MRDALVAPAALALVQERRPRADEARAAEEDLPSRLDNHSQLAAHDARVELVGDLEALLTDANKRAAVGAAADAAGAPLAQDLDAPGAEPRRRRLGDLAAGQPRGVGVLIVVEADGAREGHGGEVGSFRLLRGAALRGRAVAERRRARAVSYTHLRAHETLMNL
eukprot:3154376-Prymnesium_polylepis.1